MQNLAQQHPTNENGYLNLNILNLDTNEMEKLYQFLFDKVKTRINIPSHLFYKLKDLFTTIGVNMDSIKIISVRKPVDERRIIRFLDVNKNAFKEIISIFIELDIELPENIKELTRDLK